MGHAGDDAAWRGARWVGPPGRLAGPRAGAWQVAP